MATSENHSVLTRVCATFVGAIFYLSAFAKAGAPDETLGAFRYVLRDAPPVPVNAQQLVYLLVFAEVALATALAFYIAPRLSTLCACLESTEVYSKRVR